jgi:ABC-type glycerol-3-phosphate transport system permease component
MAQRVADTNTRGWPSWLRELRDDWPLLLILIVGLGLSLIPTYFNVLLSFKDMGQFFTEPIGLSFPLHFENYRIAFIVLWRPFLNSVLVAAATVIGTLIVSALAAYAFARFRFPGRDQLYWLVLMILFIPGILTFITRFVLVADYGLLNSYWVLILPSIAGQQVFQIFVLRSFFAALPEDLLEAARVDGANLMHVLWHIVLPLSRPIMATLAIIELLNIWNDWLWPLVTISDPDLRPMALQVLFMATDVGPHVGYQMAGYVLATIPMIIVFAIFSRQFVEGLSSGALKW